MTEQDIRAAMARVLAIVDRTMLANATPADLKQVSVDVGAIVTQALVDWHRIADNLEVMAKAQHAIAHPVLTAQ